MLRDVREEAVPAPSLPPSKNIHARVQHTHCHQAIYLPVCDTCCQRSCIFACSCSRGLAALAVVSCTTWAAAACMQHAARDVAMTHSDCPSAMCVGTAAAGYRLCGT